MVNKPSITIMKKTLFYLVCFCCLLLSCEESIDLTPQLTVKSESIMFDTVEATSIGGEYVFIITTNTEWTAEANVEWITTSSNSGGAGNDISITIRIDSNNSYEKRLGKITFECKGVKEVITIIQSQQDVIILGEKEYNLSSETQQLPIIVSSNIDVKIEIPSDVDWIILDQTNKAMTDKKFILNITENDHNERIAKVVLKNTTTNISEEIIITQDKKLYLADFNGSFVPKYATWIIYDKETTTVDFLELNNTLNSLNREVCLIFPNLESMPNGAFDACKNLQKISLIKSQSIGEGAFYYCQDLIHVDLPEALEINSAAFKGCKKLTTIKAPNLESILGDVLFARNGAFADCSSLTSVSLPNVIHIGNGAFYSCRSLMSINAPITETIGFGAFHSCNKLQSIKFDKLQKIDGWPGRIDNGAFEHCISLSTVTLPTLRDLGHEAFRNCTALTSVVLPKTINIYENAFADCNNMEALELATDENSKIEFISTSLFSYGDWGGSLEGQITLTVGGVNRKLVNVNTITIDEISYTFKNIIIK